MDNLEAREERLGYTHKGKGSGSECSQKSHVAVGWVPGILTDEVKR